jgi:hypothetical protein
MIVKVFYHGRPVHKSMCTDGPDGKPCEICAKASAEARRRWRQAKAAAIARDPSLAPHGTITTYRNWGCKCAACREVGTALRSKYPFAGTGKDGFEYRRRIRVVEPFGRDWLSDDA